MLETQTLAVGAEHPGEALVITVFDDLSINLLKSSIFVLQFPIRAETEVASLLQFFVQAVRCGVLKLKAEVGLVEDVDALF